MYYTSSSVGRTIAFRQADYRRIVTLRKRQRVSVIMTTLREFDHFDNATGAPTTRSPPTISPRD